MKDFNFTEIPGLVDVFSGAIKDGRNWGSEFLDDPQWGGDHEKMANHAIYESTMWSIGAGVATGLVGIAGIPVDLVNCLYSQVKLSSALFTIHGYDTSNESIWIIIIAAAAGVSLTELATHFGTAVAIKAIQKAVLNKPLRVLMKINGPLTIKIISKIAGKNAARAIKAIPAVGGIVGGGVNAVMMNACGHGVIKVIKAGA